MKLNVPNELVNVLSAIADMDESHLAALLHALSNIPPELFPYDDLESAINHADLGDFAERARLPELLNGLLFYASSSPKASQDAIQAIEESVPDNIAADKLRQFLNKLFSISTLYASYKGTRLLQENEKLLVGSKVITDIRPIFNSGDQVSEVVANLVVHQLKLTYEKISGNQELVLTLREEDLGSLIADLQRAESKGKIIKAGLNNALGLNLKDKS